MKTALGPLLNFNVCFRLRGKGAPGQASALRFGGRRVRRLPSGARSLGPSPNSLRSLRSLRSNRRREVSSRSALRARAKSPVLLSAEVARCHLPGPAFAETSVVFPANTSPLFARGGRQLAGAISGATRSAALGARARSALRSLTCRHLSERRERSERSEFVDGPQARAPQCSRRTRRPPPHEPLPAAARREPRIRRKEERTFADVSNGPKAVVSTANTNVAPLKANKGTDH
jgi:hypothetical protein